MKHFFLFLLLDAQGSFASVLVALMEKLLTNSCKSAWKSSQKNAFGSSIEWGFHWVFLWGLLEGVHSESAKQFLQIKIIEEIAEDTSVGFSSRRNFENNSRMNFLGIFWRDYLLLSPRGTLKSSHGEKNYRNIWRSWRNSQRKFEKNARRIVFDNICKKNLEESLKGYLTKFLGNLLMS